MPKQAQGLQFFVGILLGGGEKSSKELSET